MFIKGFKPYFVSAYVHTLMNGRVEHRMKSSKRRRGRVEVICDILSEALDGANKTRLMYNCNLNFLRFNNYLAELLDAGLLSGSQSTPESIVMYTTTDKGRELLKVLRKAGEFMST